MKLWLRSQQNKLKCLKHFFPLTIKRSSLPWILLLFSGQSCDRDNNWIPGGQRWLGFWKFRILVRIRVRISESRIRWQMERSEKDRSGSKNRIRVFQVSMLWIMLFTSLNVINYIFFLKSIFCFVSSTWFFCRMLIPHRTKQVTYCLVVTFSDTKKTGLGPLQIATHLNSAVH